MIDTITEWIRNNPDFLIVGIFIIAVELVLLLNFIVKCIFKGIKRLFKKKDKEGVINNTQKKEKEDIRITEHPSVISSEAMPLKAQEKNEEKPLESPQVIPVENNQDYVEIKDKEEFNRVLDSIGEKKE